jgi:glyoxylase-like metal-dependent hydrolase (beta-lactamase superfamily II)
VRAVGLHADVIVTVSRAFQTTCTLVRSGGEAFCIDSPVFPDELEILPAIAEQAGFGVVGLLVTHADWDHLLGRYAFPEAPLGCAETTAARLVGHPAPADARA